jgi:hypothetical protein
MHTAICTFEDRALAEQAVERLSHAGFARHDIHMEHRNPDGTPRDDEGRDHDVVGKFSFFERLFGAGRGAPHVDKYASAVESGLYVVLVEHQDEAEAERAQNVLHGMEAREVSLHHRPGERPLRDVVAERAGTDLERSFGTAREDMGASHNEDVAREFELERPIASQGGWGEQDKLQVVDEDRPIASPSIAAQKEDKPR